MQLDHHLKQDCLYEMAKCNYCSGVFQRLNLTPHTAECPLRPVKCSSCGQDGTYLHMSTEHEQQCPEVEVTCTNSSAGCTWKGLRRHLANHCSSKYLK